MKKVISTLALIVSLSTPSYSQEYYGGCAAQGGSFITSTQILNRRKNRWDVPHDSTINRNVTLASMLVRQNDVHTFDTVQAVEITGYVTAIRLQLPPESDNCYSWNPDYVNVVIELSPSPTDTERFRRIFAVVTPRIRTVVSRQGYDWSYRNLLCLMGYQVRLTGWLVYNSFDAELSENTSSGGHPVMRATAWEIHPITQIDIVLER